MPRSTEDGPLHPKRPPRPHKPSTIASSKAAREQAQAAPAGVRSEEHARAVAPARALNLRRAASEGYSIDPTAYGSGKYHPLPTAPEARALLLRLAREYKARSGRNLFAQPSIPHALMSVNITTPQEIMQHTIDAETAREARKAGGRTRETERETRRLEQQASSGFADRLAAFRATQGHRQSSTPADHLIRSAANGLAQGSQPLWAPFVGAAATIEQTALNRARGAHTTSPLRGDLGTIQSNVSDVANAAQGVNEHLADYATRGQVGFDANALVDAFGIPLDLAQVETAAAAGDPNAKKQLAEAQRQGVKLLSPEMRQTAEQRAIQRGWSKDDAAKALDSDLIRMAFNAPGSGAAGLLHNAASDVGAFLSLPAGAAEGASAVAQSVTSGNPTPALDYAQRTFVDPNLQLGSGLLHNPLHTLYQHPVFAPTLASAAFKFADAALGHTPGVRYAIPGSWRDPRRVVTLPSGKTVDLGAAAHGPIQRGIQRIAERRIEAGAPTIAKNVGRGWRMTTADAKVTAHQAMEAGHAVMNETTAQVERLSAPLQRAARGLTRDQLTSVFWAENYGTTPAGVARAFRHYAENPKLDPARAADLNALAETFDHLEPVYQKLVSSPKGRAKVDAIRAHATELASHGDAALRDLGIDPIDVREQALVAHPEAVAAAVDPVREATRTQGMALTDAVAQARRDAFKSITPYAKDARRVGRQAAKRMREIDKTLYSDQRLEAAKALTEQRRAVRDFENVAIGTGRRRAIGSGSSISHVEFVETPGGGRIVGAKQNADGSWTLRKHLTLRHDGTKWSLQIGEAKNGYRETFNSGADAIHQARSLEGIALGPKMRKTTLTRKVTTRDTTRAAETAGTAHAGQVRAASDFSHLHEPEHAKITTARERLKAANDRVKQTQSNLADFEARSVSDRAMRDVVAEGQTRSSIGLQRARAMKGAVEARTALPGRFQTPEMTAYLDRIAERQAFKEAAPQRVEAAIEGVKQGIGDQAFAYTRHTSSPRRHGAKSGTPSSSPFSVNARSLLGGARDLKRHGTLYRTGELNVDPYHVIEDLSQPITARGMQRSVEEVVKTAGRKIESGDSYDPRTEVVVQTGGIKNSIDAKGGADARTAAMVEKQAELLGATISPDTLRQLYDVTFTAKHSVDPETGLAKVDGEHHAIPIEVWNDFKDRAAARLSLNRGSAHKAMKLWRAVALNTVPGTAVRNSIGSLMFGMMHGASLKSFLDAAKMMRDGTAPDWLTGRGVVSSEHGRFVDKFIGRADVKIPGTDIQVRPLKPIAVYMDFLRAWNQVSENYARVVIGVSEAKKIARGDQSGFANVMTRLGKSNEAYTETMKALMDRRDPRWRDLLKETNAWLGDMSKTSSLDAKLGNIVAFHRWYAHMLSLTLWTMPVHYPGRTVLLQNIADEGRKYLKEHGVWPSYLADSMIVSSQVLPKLTGQEQGSLISQLMPTSGWNVTATGPQLLQTDSSGDLAPLAAASNISPPLSLLVDAIGGADPAALIQGRKSYDENGNPISGLGQGNLVTTLELLANRGLRMLPPYNAVFPQSGYADNAVGGINRVPRLERYPHTNLPITNPDFMSPREGTGLEALAGRLFGLRTKPYAVSGPVADMNVTREWKRQKANAAAERAKRQKAERAKAARERMG